jgi:hypothetical protein
MRFALPVLAIATFLACSHDTDMDRIDLRENVTAAKSNLPSTSVQADAVDKQDVPHVGFVLMRSSRLTRYSGYASVHGDTVRLRFEVTESRNADGTANKAVLDAITWTPFELGNVFALGCHNVRDNERMWTVAVVHDTLSDRYGVPIVAWYFDTATANIVSIAPGSVTCVQTFMDLR